MLPRFDIILEIVFLTLLYHNDKISLKHLRKEEVPKTFFVYINDNNNDLINTSVTLFISVLKFINFIKANENPKGQPNKIIFEQSFSQQHLKNLYDSHKINYIIKQIFELLIESRPKCKLS